MSRWLPRMRSAPSPSTTVPSSTRTQSRCGYAVPIGTVPIGTAYPHLDWVLVDDGTVVDGEGELCMRGNQRLISYLDPADNAGRFYRVANGVALDRDGGPVVPDDA